MKDRIPLRFKIRDYAAMPCTESAAMQAIPLGLTNVAAPHARAKHGNSIWFLEWKLFFLLADRVFLAKHDFFCAFVDIQAVDDDRLVRAHRADVFATAATDAKIWIDHGNRQSVTPRDHVDGLGRAMFRAGPAGSAIGFHNAATAEKLGDAGADEAALVHRERLNRTSRTNL